MNEIKNEKMPREETGEEVFDQDLQKMFGERYVDKTVQPEEQSVEEEPAAPAIHWGRIKAAGGLILADALLMFMCMTGKIELAYGLVFLATASAFFGAKMNNARV